MLNILHVIAAKVTQSAIPRNHLSMVALLDKETSESLPVFGIFHELKIMM
jgi:hypothetical protein